MFNKCREKWRIFSFIVPAHGQGEGATISSVAWLDATWVRGAMHRAHDRGRRRWYRR